MTYKGWHTRRTRGEPPHPGWLWCSGHQDYHAPDEFGNRNAPTFANRGFKEWVCRVAHNEYLRAHDKKHDGRCYRNSKLKAAYGLTADDVDGRIAGQGGLCAICGNPPKEGRRLHVDHNHRTGQIRAMLCSLCNQRLGFIENGWAIKAQAYLDLWNAEGWLDFVDENDLHAKFAVDE
jgi:hypothetical protein